MVSNNLIQQKETEKSIKEETEQELSLRAQRYLKVKPHEIIPYKHFSPASAECPLLFRDGHYYGCITLTQSVAEAIVRFLCQKNFRKANGKAKKDFKKNIDKLLKRQFISEKLKNKFLKIWENRDNYHHLKKDIEVQLIKLEEISYEKVLLLKEIESEIFKSFFKNGKFIPGNEKYWEQKENGKIPAFLRFSK